MEKLWTEKEIKILKDNYKSLSIVELLELLPDRSKSSIRKKAHREGFTMKTKKWTSEENKILIKKYCSKESIEDIAKRLFNRSKKSIATRAHNINISSKKIPWTSEEMNKLKEYYPIENKEDLNKRFNRTCEAIKHKASRMNISKANDSIEEE